MRAIHFRERRRQSPARPFENRDRHGYVALEFGGRCLGLRRHWALGLQVQGGFGENALPHRARPVLPGRIQLPGLPCVAVAVQESGGQFLAILLAHSRGGHQILQCHLRRDPPFTHLLLDGFGQDFSQRQASRHPARAAVEAVRQLLQRVAESPLQFRQQPTLFQRRFLLAIVQCPVQQHRFGLAHLPYRGFHGVPLELLECGDARVSVDHHVAPGAACGSDHDDRALLTALSQRCQQARLAVRLAHPQVFPGPVQLMKFQSHGTD